MTVFYFTNIFKVPIFYGKLYLDFSDIQHSICMCGDKPRPVSFSLWDIPSCYGNQAVTPVKSVKDSLELLVLVKPLIITFAANGNSLWDPACQCM